MQYPYSSNNNADITRSNIKSNNNTEHQPRDTKESNIGDINPKSGRPRDTGKPEDTSSHGTFAINNAQSTKQQPSSYNICEINTSKCILNIYQSIDT
jgi:hypothetical protein